VSGYQEEEDVANKRHNAAFVVGSVLGGLVGAGVALWKTPYSGPELRSMLTGGPGEGHTAGTTTASDEPLRFSSRLLSQVENTLAPVVGVRLGKTANDSGPQTEDSLMSAAVAHQEVAPASENDAATVEQLTHPQVDIKPEALKEEGGVMKPFPDLGGNEPRA
jgi:gas vesicle protein